MGKDGKVETSILEQFSLRWLGKALTGFKPKGCLTDLVNLIFAMENIEPNKDMLCWVLLDFIRNKMDLKKLKVHIQLPESDKFETLERRWKDLGENVTTFKDVNSRNEAALLHNFGLD